MLSLPVLIVVVVYQVSLRHSYAMDEAAVLTSAVASISSEGVGMFVKASAHEQNFELR
jgi:hypothetical protein